MNKKDSSNTTKVWTNIRIRITAQIQFMFLQMSPSYELANRALNKELSDIDHLIDLVRDLYKPKSGVPLTDGELTNVFADFMKVVQLRTEFGDLNKITFDEWWKTIGVFYYGIEKQIPHVRLIAAFEEDQEKIEEGILLEKYKQYIEEWRSKEYKPKALIVSIPMGVPKQKILKQLDSLIEEHKTPIVPIAPDKHPFEHKRLRTDALINSFHVLRSWAIVMEPIQLWRFAIMTKISPANAIGLKFADRPTQHNVYERNVLAVLAHRALSQAQYIAENAAHGRFPSRQKCRLPRFDQAAINERVSAIEDMNKVDKLKSETPRS